MPGPTYSPNSGSSCSPACRGPGTARPRRCPRRVDRAADHAGVVEDAVDLGGVVPRWPTSPTIPSISSWFSPRARCVAKRASSASSGCSIASHSRRKTLSAFAAITIHVPSLDLKMFDGATPFEPGAAGAAHDPEAVVLGDGALEQREARLHQRHVDDLAAAAAEHVAPVERREDALHGEHAGQRVAERDVDPRRRLAGEAVDVADAAHRLGHGGEARPRPRTGRSGRSPRCARSRAAGSPPRAARGRCPSAPACPGRKFSTSTSLRSTRASSSCCPRSSRRFSVTHFLLRDCTGHQSERPSVARLAPLAQRVGLARAARP